MDKFDKLKKRIDAVLSDYARVDCGLRDYIDALKDVVSDIEILIDAAESDLRREDGP